MGEGAVVDVTPSAELTRLTFCPACGDADVPAPGQRCIGHWNHSALEVRAGATTTAFDALRCRACRCPCGALCRGQLWCPHCRTLMPVQLRRVKVQLPADDGPRGGVRATTRTTCYVDRNGSGGIWVAASAWPRLTSSDEACDAVLAACREVEGCELLIVGKAVRLEKDAPVPPGPGQVVIVPTGKGEDERLWLSVRDKPSPAPYPDRLRVPVPALMVPVDVVVAVLENLDAATREGGSRAERQAAAEKACGELRDRLSIELVGDHRVRPDVDDLLVYRLSGVLRGHRHRLSDDRLRSWSPAYLEGRHFCGGRRCPGYSAAGYNSRHPETCLEAGQLHGDMSPARQAKEAERRSEDESRTRRLNFAARLRGPFSQEAS